MQAPATWHSPKSCFISTSWNVFYEDSRQTLWTYMRPNGRPSFTPTMLTDFVNWQRLIGANFGPERVPLRFLVLGSRVARRVVLRRRSRAVSEPDPCPRLLRTGAIWLQMRGNPPSQHAVARPADDHHRAGRRRGAGRRFRGAAVVRLHHRRTRGDLRPARSAVRAVPGHGRAFDPHPQARQRDGRPADRVEPDLYRRTDVRTGHRPPAGRTGRRRSRPAANSSTGRSAAMADSSMRARR